MDATLRLRPLAAFTACLVPLAVCAVEPCDGDCFETPAVCAPGAGGCSSGACKTGTSRTGTCRNPACSCGRGGACVCRRGTSGASRVTRTSWGDDDDGYGDWFDHDHDTGPVGSSQKCKHGKLWPPYPRPRENGEWSTQYHAAMYWPHPYNCWDRSYVRQITAIQTANGWAQATTLYTYHFDPETNGLNHSGRIHLRWILEQCPAQFRTVYVQSANSALASDARMASVQGEAAEIAGVSTAPVVVRPVQLAGRPANEVDSIRRAEITTMPQPRIEIDDVGTGSGGKSAAQ
jgi:hypothetical protein